MASYDRDFRVKNGLIVGGDITFSGTLTGDGSGLSGVSGVTSYNDLTDKPTLFSGSYNDLTDKPSIPTLTSQLTNDSGFITSSSIPTNVSSFTNDSGYLTSYTETDPVYTASSWYTTTNNSSNWNTAYGWGNHASAGYLTSYTETDPVYTASSWYTTTNNSSNWNTAYGWGNHASAGYAQLSAATNNFTGNIQIDGDLTVSGTQNIINTTDLAVEDNMIYLNSTSIVANPDLGFAGNYNDGTYAHTGIFRDASDGRWKFYDSYTPEPDASAFIDTTHGSFNLATVQAGAFIGDGSGLTGVVKTVDIGSTVQGYDADTAKYDDTTANFTGTLQQGGSNVLTGNQTITLSGDASGSGTTSIVVTVADDSHNHIISNVDGLQSALDGKQPLDADLTAIGGLANTDGNFIVGNGTTWVAENGATARTSLGLGSIATQNSNSVSITGGTITGITDLTVADGGTGRSTLTANNVLLGNGTSAVNFVAPGTSGNVLTSNGTTWTSAPAAGGGGISYSVKTANYTASANEGIIADTSGGAFTVTLPATPSTGDQVVIADGADWSTNNLTVGRNGSTIEGTAEDLVCDIQGVSIQFVYDGSTWEVYALAAGSGSNANALTSSDIGTTIQAYDADTAKLDVVQTFTAAQTFSTDATVNGLTVGKGASAVQYNTAFGVTALNANTTGSDNVAVGYETLLNNTTGDNNTAIGRGALQNNVNGSYNTTIGHASLFNNIGGASNTAIGQSALLSNTSGSNNVAIGYQALVSNTTASYNTAVGYEALRDNTTTGGSNTAVGFRALENNTTGSRSTALGYQVLAGNTTGVDNVSIGFISLGTNTTGRDNTAVGMSALENNTTANNNVALGFQALYSNTTGLNNTAIGTAAVDANVSSSNNTGVGVAALGAVTGGQNTSLGTNSGNTLTTGSNNTLIGYNAQPSSATVSNEITLGDANVTTVRMGNGDVIYPAAGGGSATVPAFSAYLSANQSINAATWTKLQLDTEEFDLTNDYDNTTNYRFTPSVPGYYQISATADMFTVANAQSLSFFAYKNGFASLGAGGASFANGSSASARSVISRVIYMNGTTDYIEFYVYQIAGGLMNAVNGPGYTSAQAILIHPA